MYFLVFDGGFNKGKFLVVFMALEKAVELAKQKFKQGVGSEEVFRFLVSAGYTEEQAREILKRAGKPTPVIKTKEKEVEKPKKSTNLIILLIALGVVLGLLFLLVIGGIVVFLWFYGYFTP